MEILSGRGWWARIPSLRSIRARNLMAAATGGFSGSTCDGLALPRLNASRRCRAGLGKADGDGCASADLALDVHHTAEARQIVAGAAQAQTAPAGGGRL